MIRHLHSVIKKIFRFSHPIIFVGSILIIALAIFINRGLAAWTSQTIDKEHETHLSSTPTPDTNLETTGSREGWRIHKDPERGFIVEYPQTWYLYDPGPKDFYGVTTISTYDPYSDDVDWTSFRLTENDLKVQLFWAFYDKSTSPQINKWIHNYSDEAGLLIQSIAEDMIGGKTVISVIERDETPQGGGYSIQTYYIPHGGQVFVVSADPFVSVHQPTLELIVASIQFID
jgi:hypothetical protein